MHTYSLVICVCCSHASRRPGCFAVLSRSRCWIHSSSCSLQEWPCAELRPGVIRIWFTVSFQHNPRIFLESLIRESLLFRIMHSFFMLRCVIYFFVCTMPLHRCLPGSCTVADHLISVRYVFRSTRKSVAGTDETIQLPWTVYPSMWRSTLAWFTDFRARDSAVWWSPAG